MDKISVVVEKIQNLFVNEKYEDNSYAKDIEQKLNLKLPYDFHQLSQYFNGKNTFILHDLFSLDSKVKGYNVVEQTLFYRNSHEPLPHKYLALGESSVSFIVLDTETGRVIEMATNDYGNLVEGEELCDSPKYFNSYADFFEYLLDEEEKERKENT